MTNHNKQQLGTAIQVLMTSIPTGSGADRYLCHETDSLDLHLDIVFVLLQKDLLGEKGIKWCGQEFSFYLKGQNTLKCFNLGDQCQICGYHRQLIMTPLAFI